MFVAAEQCDQVQGFPVSRRLPYADFLTISNLSKMAAWR
jgi:hypothetical protein